MSPLQYLEKAELITAKRGDYKQFCSAYEKAREIFGIEESVVAVLFELYGKESYQILFGEE